MIKRIENVLAMLSGSIKSHYSINKGDNDDYKVLLPYYFEVQNKLDNPSAWVRYTDIIVKLKSNYETFTKNGFIFEDKNISQSNIFQLEHNHFAFPELTKNVETASIPSSMPLDQQLANGEYSKYKMLNFAKNSNLKTLYLNRYGSGDMKFDPFSPSLHNEGEFALEKESRVEELEISAFYGYGNWFIEFITTNNNKYKLNINLFSKLENTKTLLNLIL
ncbi:hypothetical protein [Williamsoniiplasma luminosum]|uniref:Uncharacterized protein n=1 Tax=Williamsoniiplasma luminosum TaxID=214888 RepID=A0A2S0NJ66_9MOLU|nr:hypothetical protein [Williamsoniiplasma luminosum]AVP49054.1 MAG: hypothetical protein C5T88_00440 [Williamsoniiplasma luminosum]